MEVVLAVVQQRRALHAPGSKSLQTRRHRPDYWLVILSAALLAIGLIVVYAISPGLAIEKHVGQSYFVNRQLISIGLGIVGFVIVAHVPLEVWRHIQKPLIIVAGVSAIAVRLFGEQVNGAYRWIQVGGFSFQAVELIKFALLIWVAGFLSERIYRGELGDSHKALRPLLVALFIVGVVVAGLQSDLGSTGVIVAMIAVMAYVAGMPLKRIATIGLIVVLLGTLAVSTTSYRRQRLSTFLHPTNDCLAAGYQSCQALIAVGSGGLFGLGLGRSVQAFGYLPEAENDSIFAIYAEKFGFIGISVLLALFVALFARLKQVIDRAPDDFSRFLVTGIFVWLSTQALINIGAMIGLLPLKGITLPFISYGGTSVVFVAAVIGLAFQISRYTNYGMPREGKLSGNRSDASRPTHLNVKGPFSTRRANGSGTRRT